MTHAIAFRHPPLEWDDFVVSVCWLCDCCVKRRRESIEISGRRTTNGSGCHIFCGRWSLFSNRALGVRCTRFGLYVVWSAHSIDTFFSSSHCYFSCLQCLHNIIDTSSFVVRCRCTLYWMSALDRDSRFFFFAFVPFNTFNIFIYERRQKPLRF